MMSKANEVILWVMVSPISEDEYEVRGCFASRSEAEIAIGRPVSDFDDDPSAEVSAFTAVLDTNLWPTGFTAE